MKNKLKLILIIHELLIMTIFLLYYFPYWKKNLENMIGVFYNIKDAVNRLYEYAESNPENLIYQPFNYLKSKHMADNPLLNCYIREINPEFFPLESEVILYFIYDDKLYRDITLFNLDYYHYNYIRNNPEEISLEKN